ncbi:RDD family protein [Pseudoclavibacter sp. RFBJ3]|uniref:RDD family protein n=1 Tax=unclassified Pseudoclavibacter TaxID=2615177 RepID=UPI000CE86AB3|nr:MULTISPECIES: RDD family protein [unclassified Pseudoclavibacter]PPF40052.1 RDD family protein [Pseudoclavibacter sp. AY1H1]PPF75946.1 RDD family protein [Pseudoclavibacter sp. Z016]PPF84960.1 RDD family protein [Pseudoclavibacter sp. RFBJ5]PPF93964.1 RDD family protein [Pseudoclavibacter sp. RFBJ3]PPF98681.1 RDD family protein [Pseudoclavibacter sp. RFBH5]
MPAQSSSPEFARPENNRYPGYRLGYPEEGRGSIGPMRRRIPALIVDYALAAGVAFLFFDYESIAILLLFFSMSSVGIMLFGGSAGHLLFRMRVTRLDGSAPGYVRPLIRQLLVTLVLPMLVWDSDQRGGHDIMTKLALRLV